MLFADESFGTRLGLTEMSEKNNFEKVSRQQRTHETLPSMQYVKYKMVDQSFYCVKPAGRFCQERFDKNTEIIIFFLYFDYEISTCCVIGMLYVQK